jgi:hypothetical protein
MPEAVLQDPPQKSSESSITPEEVDSTLQLGAIIVEAVQAQAGVLVGKGDELFADFSGEDIERHGEGDIKDKVTTNQVVLSNMADDQGRIDFLKVLDTLEPPAALRTSLGARDNGDMIERILTAKDRPRTVANFFEWYQHTLGEHRARFDEHEKPQLLADFDANLAAAAKAGIVPDFLPERLRLLQSNGKLHVKLVDHSLLKGGGKTGGALHFDNGEELVFLQLGYEGHRERTFTHESLHTLEGAAGQADDKPDDDTGITAGGRGLYRLFGFTEGGRAINEAVIEHVTDSILHGNVGVVLPTSNERENNIDDYPVNRFLLYVLCERGAQSIDPRVFINAAFEDGSAEDSPANKLLEEELNKAFPGFGVVDRLSNIKASDPQTLTRFMGDFVKEWEQFMQQNPHQAANTEIKPLATSDFEKVFLTLLANDQGILKRSVPARPDYAPDVTSSVDAEIRDLRSQGKSEKQAIRGVVKRHHTDTNQGMEAEQKVRAATRRLDEFNKREGRKLADNS